MGQVLPWKQGHVSMRTVSDQWQVRDIVKTCVSLRALRDTARALDLIITEMKSQWKLP